MDEPRLPGADELPRPVARRRRRHIPLVWLIPIVAALTAAWLGWRALSEHGPTIAITFRNADGIEAGTTRIKYRNVEVGRVTRVNVSHDRKSVVVSAQLVRGADDWLRRDTSFWVVRPRIGTGGVSGLGTLFSGSYIGMDVGKSPEMRDAFIGLEVPPVVTADQEGRRYMLRADDVGSLDIGSPVYFRRLTVGQIVSRQLDPSGKGATVQVFVHAPYDQFVRPGTRFWHASGVNVSLDATGLSLNTPSIVSMIAGGVEFGFLPGREEGVPLSSGSEFKLLPDRRSAMADTGSPRHQFLLVFRESVRGLAVGAPVEFRGLKIGEVTDFRVEYDSKRQDLAVPVFVTLSGDAVQVDGGKPNWLADRSLLDRMVQRGLRAQLRSANVVTGQLYVAVDFVPQTPLQKIDWSASPPRLPAVRGNMQALSESAERIARRVEAIPIEDVVRELRGTMRSLDQTLKSFDKVARRVDGELAPAAKETVDQARRTLSAAEKTLGSDSPLQSEAREALREVSRAAQSLRILTDYLERHPESLLRGKDIE